MNRYACVHSLYTQGSYVSFPVLVEASIRRGLPNFRITGLGHSNSRETAERIQNAIRSSGIHLPYLNLSVNLLPADIKKKGAYLDLSIAVSLLLALGEPVSPNSMISKLNCKTTIYLGELSLSGEIRSVQGIHHLLHKASQNGFQTAVIPREQYLSVKCFHESNLGNKLGIKLEAISHLKELLMETFPVPPVGGGSSIRSVRPECDLDILRLNPKILRAMVFSAAGWHSLLLVGPPGTGKSTIARNMISLLPPPSPREAGEILSDIARERSINQDKENMISIQRPVRIPHHSVTRRAMVGGGIPISSGEVTKAHNGILVLDELGEFSRETLQALREPLQEKTVQISRGEQSVQLPARFLLCATTNPCPCGDLANRYVRCFCTDLSLKNYAGKFMGALRDRIDIEVWVDKQDELREDMDLEKIFRNIDRVYEMQKQRFRNTSIQFNGDVSAKDLLKTLPLGDEGAKNTWEKLNNQSDISYRSLAGIRRLGRTAADLNGHDQILSEDLLEAASFRYFHSIW